MAVVCPSILASNETDYKTQIERIAHIAKRMQIDLTDGQFAKAHTISPHQAWWPVGFAADFHLMYNHPAQAAKVIMQHKPNLIIVHAEADGNFEDLAVFCHQHGVKIGVALLQQTSAEAILSALHLIDHVLIFSGELGRYGGHADMKQLEKASYLKRRKPGLEVGWDGGINDQNISHLVFGGIDVLNVGGYIQSAENPAHAFHVLQRIADETGTT